MTTPVTSALPEAMQPDAQPPVSIPFRAFAMVLHVVVTLVTVMLGTGGVLMMRPAPPDPKEATEAFTTAVAVLQQEVSTLHKEIEKGNAKMDKIAEELAEAKENRWKAEDAAAAHAILREEFSRQFDALLRVQTDLELRMRRVEGR